MSSRSLGGRFEAASRWVAAAATLVLLLHAIVSAQTGQPPRDYEVKAVYLYNFSRFATWPAAAAPKAGEFDVCVLGRDPFGATLDAALAGENVDGKRVVARRMAKAQAAAGCRILFVSASEDAEWPHILAALGGASILTVSDMPDFAERGGMIQFVTQDHKIRFEVNLVAAEQASVTLSSDLLKVASAVRRGKEQSE